MVCCPAQKYTGLQIQDALFFRENREGILSWEIDERWVNEWTFPTVKLKRAYSRANKRVHILEGVLTVQLGQSEGPNNGNPRELSLGSVFGMGSLAPGQVARREVLGTSIPRCFCVL